MKIDQAKPASVKKKKLTDKQRVIVDEYLIDMNKAQALIRAGYSKNTAYQSAGDYFNQPHMIEAIQEGQQAAQKRRQETLDDILNELDVNRRAALDAETVQSAAATTATMAKARLLGFDVDRQDPGSNVTVNVNTINPTVSPAELEEMYTKLYGPLVHTIDQN